MTARLLQAFIVATNEASDTQQTITIDRYDCFTRAPLPCNDCRACSQHSGCIRPDLDDFYASLEQADVLVFASPVYNLSFPAPMKALIDRMQCYWAERFVRGVRPPIARPKQAVLLTSCGADSQEGGDMLERQLKPVLTILNARLVQSVHYTGADKENPLSPYLTAARQAALLLAETSC